MSTLTVSLVQYDIKWLDKEANFKALESIIHKHFAKQADGRDSVDLLLLPETFSTGFCVADAAVKQPEDGGDDLNWLKKIAREYNCVVAGTVFVAVCEQCDDKKANRFYWVWPDGSSQFYDKRHLFRLGHEGDYVAQGQDRKIININGIRILPQVCYDLRFPVWSRSKRDYDLLVNVANWPAARRHAWDTLLKARAIENQAFVIGVNRVGTDGLGVAHSGGTCVLDFVGESLAETDDDTQQIIDFKLDFSTLEKYKQDFPVFLDADEFQIIQ